MGIDDHELNEFDVHDPEDCDVCLEGDHSVSNECQYDSLAASFWSSEDEMNEAMDQALAYFIAEFSRIGRQARSQ
jgi:hypothetical protein